MIKSDAQLQRTLDQLRGFERQLEAVRALVDPTERDLAISSVRGAILRLLLKVQRYREARNGRIRMPKFFHSVHDICPYLTDFRIALGLTQESLGSKLGVTRQCINKWEEHSYVDLDATTLDRVVEVLGLRTQIKVAHDTIDFAAPVGPGDLDLERDLELALA